MPVHKPSPTHACPHGPGWLVGDTEVSTHSAGAWPAIDKYLLKEVFVKQPTYIHHFIILLILSYKFNRDKLSPVLHQWFSTLTAY